MSTPVKIYFSGSIRGGRSDAKLYRQIIDDLQNYGDVLTEHIGNESVDDEVGQTDRQIYEQDMEWLRESDIVIAEVSTPSLGVGYEIGRAVAMKKRVVCLYRSEVRDNVSAMIKGSSNLRCAEYKTVEEAKKLIQSVFNH